MNHAGSRKTLLLAAALGLAVAGGIAAAAEKATIARDTDLRAKPLNDAAVVVPLKAQTAVSVESRSGAWAQVSVGGKTGYVRLLNLRTQSAQKGDSGVKAVASVFRTGSSGHSVSTGVKGLSEEDLTGAAANPEQVKKLATYAAAKNDATESAQAAGLRATQVAYLPAPTDKKKKKKRNED